VNEKNKKVNVTDENEKTALMYAAQNLNYELCELLISKLTDVVVTEEIVKTIKQANKPDEIKIIVDETKYINLRDKTGKTALICAATNSFSGLEQKKLKELRAEKEVQGANQEELDTEIKMIFDRVTIRNLDDNNLNFRICKLLILKTAHINVRDNLGKTALMYAIGFGSSKTCEFLIKNGADVKIRDKNDKSAIMYAAEKGKCLTCDLLIEKDAYVTDADKTGKTVLMYAVERCFSENVVSKIIDNAEVESPTGENGTGKSALNHVLLQPLSDRTYNIMKALIEKPANPNYLDDSDNFPLKILMKKNAKDVKSSNGESIRLFDFVDFLIEKGAKKDFKDKTGKTAYKYAIENNVADKDVLKLLEPANPITRFFSSKSRGGVKKRLKTKRSNKNKRSQKTKTRNFRKTRHRSRV